MVTLAVEPMGGALKSPRELTPRRIRPELLSGSGPVDLQEPVQETENHRDPRKSRLERIPRHRPAVCVDRFGSVIGFGLPRLGREDAVGLSEMAVSAPHRTQPLPTVVAA